MPGSNTPPRLSSLKARTRRCPERGSWFVVELSAVHAALVFTIMITVIWDTWIKPGAEEQGLQLTRKLWNDMRQFTGYVAHQIFVDLDGRGHIVAFGAWESRADADAVRELYKDSETVRLLTPLLARPRERWVTVMDESHEA